MSIVPPNGSLEQAPGEPESRRDFSPLPPLPDGITEDDEADIALLCAPVIDSPVIDYDALRWERDPQEWEHWEQDMAQEWELWEQERRQERWRERELERLRGRQQEWARQVWGQAWQGRARRGSTDDDGPETAYGGLSVAEWLARQPEGRERPCPTDADFARVWDFRTRTGGPICRLPGSPQDPETWWQTAEHSGAPEDQLAAAGALAAAGLNSKAQRRAFCRIAGSLYHCTAIPEHKYYCYYRCRCRFCPVCAPFNYTALFSHYVQLEHETVVRSSTKLVLDFAAKKLDCLPTPADVRQFNRSITKFFRTVQSEYGIEREQYGGLYTNELSGNDRLHGHALYVGSGLLDIGKYKDLSLFWERACKGTVFEGSTITLKEAGGFRTGLQDVLSCIGKCPADPERLAVLEQVFHGVRRVHSLGAFYGMKLAKASKRELSCPICNAKLQHEEGWLPIAYAKAQGYRDLDEVRRDQQRERSFWARDGPGPWAYADGAR